jgi:hypothetical protein
LGECAKTALDPTPKTTLGLGMGIMSSPDLLNGRLVEKRKVKRIG